MGDLYTSTCAHTVKSVQQFLTKNGMNPMSHPPNSPNLSPSDVFGFVSLDEKRPHRETFCPCGRGGTKTAEALKSIIIDKFKNCFEQWKKYCIKW